MLKHYHRLNNNTITLKKHTRADLIDAVYQQLISGEGGNVSALSRANVAKIVNHFIDELKQSLLKGYPVELRGFGVFEFRSRKAKTNARNPKSGETVQVLPHTVVAFRSGNDLRNAVWNLEVHE